MAGNNFCKTRTCPVSGMPVDLMTLGNAAHQVKSHRGRWGSKLFQSALAAVDWYDSGNFTMLDAATWRREELGGTVRFVSSLGWLTEYMAEDEAESFLSKMAAAGLYKPAPGAKAKPKPKPKAPENVPENVPLAEDPGVKPIQSVEADGKPGYMVQDTKLPFKK